MEDTITITTRRTIYDLLRSIDDVGKCYEILRQRKSRCRTERGKSIIDELISYILDDDHRICYECQDLLLDSEAIYFQDKYYCETCINEIAVWVDIEGQWYSPDYYESNFSECNHCNGVFRRHDLYDAYNLHGMEILICDDCRNSSYERCDCCDELYLHDCLIAFDSGLYCRDCADNEEGIIKEYDYKPAPIYFGSPSKTLNKHTLYIGIELEVEVDDSPSRTVELAKMITQDFWYFKKDGSVDGFEIVSYPGTFEYWKSQYQTISAHLSTLQHNSCKSYDAISSCGLHFHVSRRAISMLTLWKILEFHRKFPSFMFALSQRSEYNYKRWSCNEYADKSSKFIADAAKAKLHSSRYTAVNLSNKNTIEFRIFRGTLNVQSLFAKLEFVYALIQYCRNESCSNLSLQSFKRFIEEDKKQYNNLISFINQKNLI